MKVKEEKKSRRDQGLKQSDENLEKDDLPELFAKHRMKKLLKYENFNHKVGYLDSYEFSWSIHGNNILSKFMPISTKIITNQMNLAF